MKHKHHEAIIAWANGSQIQVHDQGDWVDCVQPAWNLNHEYRVKPKNIEHFVHLYLDTSEHWGNFLSQDRTRKPNIKLVFDDNGRLNSAEMI